MLLVFGILVILTSLVLGFIVLVQNPKGGGLNSSLGSMGNQLMGVKQTTDVLEKGTWIFAAIVGVLCVVSPAFMPKQGSGSGKADDLINKAPSSAPKSSTNTAPLPGTSAPGGDSAK